MKKVEGRAYRGSPIRPARVSCRTHAITRMDNYRDAGQLRADYEDVEDFAFAHIEFQGWTVADIYANELVLGGVHNWLEVAANHHRTICSINPNTSPDEDWFTGCFQEIEAFYRTACRRPTRSPRCTPPISRRNVRALRSMSRWSPWKPGVDLSLVS